MESVFVGFAARQLKLLC